PIRRLTADHGYAIYVITLMFIDLKVKLEQDSPSGHDPFWSLFGDESSTSPRGRRLSSGASFMPRRRETGPTRPSFFMTGRR
ncbi:hypothetical protein, partial [Brevundimonas sp. MYb33]|uniref:hypothetical protein n=1 Tax=Brevundimonas sp. MYb33 TaxID=1848617 RepID=UPI001E631DC1